VTEVTEGWRVFSVADDGGLMPPVADRYWPGPVSGSWPPGIVYAACLTSDHAAPDEACTCGLRAVVKLSELLSAVSTRHLAGESETVLERCGVVARVSLSGRVFDGVEMPTDDPLTTLRAERAQIVDLHLAPRHEALTAALASRYRVPVAVYGVDEWPDAVAPLTAGMIPGTDENVALFCRHVRSLRGFGTKSTSEPEAFVPIGRMCVRAFRDGASFSEVVRGLFDSDARPTYEQAVRFAGAALSDLSGIVMSLERAVGAGLPVTRSEAATRDSEYRPRSFIKVSGFL
jgi:hypothetical protein